MYCHGSPPNDGCVSQGGKDSGADPEGVRGGGCQDPLHHSGNFFQHILMGLECLKKIVNIGRVSPELLLHSTQTEAKNVINLSVPRTPKVARDKLNIRFPDPPPPNSWIRPCSRRWRQLDSSSVRWQHCSIPETRPRGKHVGYDYIDLILHLFFC